MARDYNPRRYSSISSSTRDERLWVRLEKEITRREIAEETVADLKKQVALLRAQVETLQRIVDGDNE